MRLDNFVVMLVLDVMVSTGQLPHGDTHLMDLCMSVVTDSTA